MSSLEKIDPNKNFLGTYDPKFESLVHSIISGLEKAELTRLRKDFHTRLRITLTQPETSELVEDLWDFFYDWCVFEHKVFETPAFTNGDKSLWTGVKETTERGLYSIQKVSDEYLKLKELLTGKILRVSKRSASDYFGLEKGDIIEGRLVVSSPLSQFSFVRRPSYHPSPVHGYIKKKVREFKRSKDILTYQNWLWILVGMYLKHRIYTHMPIEKIYDDNSRI